MDSKDPFNNDFDGEFNPIKKLSEQEIENDSLVKRMKMQRHINKLEKNILVLESDGSKPDSDIFSGGSKSDESTNKRKRRSSNGSSKDESKFLSQIHQTISTKENSKSNKVSSKRYSHIKNIKLFNSMDEPNPYVSGNNEDPSDSGKSETDNKKTKYIFSGAPQPSNVTSNNGAQVDTLHEESILDGSDSSDDSIEISGVPENETSSREDEKNIENEVLSEAFDKYKNFVPDINDFQKIKTRVLGQLTGKLGFPNLFDCSSLMDKYNEIYTMFEHTVRDNEGHSALLIGPRASGKSSIINHALENIQRKYEGQYIIVKLNAFIHSDDATALREIARQLDENTKKLKMLHPEINNDPSKEHGNFEQRSIGDTFLNILTTLDKDSDINEILDSTLDQSTISIIFLIDEFEKFTSNNKQTLLYNLFDLSQSSSIPICVVGITTKITTRELLEKRVRSRFSQRIISINRSTSIEEFWSHAKLNLTLNENFISELNNRKHGIMWNKYFEILYSERGPLSSSYLKKLVFQNYYTLKNFKSFCNNCVFTISSINLSEPFPKDSNFKKYVENQSPNYIQSVIESLSSLELLLVIAAARWVEKYDLQVVNFNLAFKEYEDMIKNFNVVSNTSNTSTLGENSVLTNIKVNQKIWSAKILKNSWEILYKLSIIMDPATTSGDSNMLSSASHSKSVIIQENKMVQLDITLDELGHLMEDSNIYKRLTKL